MSLKIVMSCGLLWSAMPVNAIVDNQIIVYSPISKDTACNYTVNSVGVGFDFDITMLKPTDLGQIVIDKQVQVLFPLFDKRQLYRFTPTQGGRLIRNKPVLILIVPFDIAGENPEKFSTVLKKEALAGRQQNPWATVMYKVYRQFQDQHVWTEVATIFSQKAIEPQLVKLKPDGNLITAKMSAEDGADAIAREISGQTITLFLGKF